MPDPNSAPKKKDLWDKLGAGGPLAVALVISIIGSWFTYNYNQRQIRIQEVQTVEGFMQYLLGDQESNELAILAISSLGNTRLATELAERFSTPGTASALQTIIATGDEEDQALADSALRAVQNRLQRLVDNMMADDRQTRISATNELVRKWTSEPSIVELVLERASERIENPSGRINTLILLENIDIPLLNEYKAEVDSLLRQFSTVGDTHTDEHVQAVRTRLNASRS